MAAKWTDNDTANGMGKEQSRYYMDSLGQAQDTISGDDTYQVTATESREILDHEATRIDQQLAEFDSYRRRTRKELAEAQQSKREVLLALLDIMDDFDRALLHIREAPDAIVEGLQLIHGRLNDVLLSNGVNAFDSEGQPFDPVVHEAMSIIEADNAQESGTVYAEDRRGYLLNGELLRAARVVVLK